MSGEVPPGHGQMREAIDVRSRFTRCQERVEIHGVGSRSTWCQKREAIGVSSRSTWCQKREAH